jgi:uncharacterized membrane protein YjjP (DUF1212 family)
MYGPSPGEHDRIYAQVEVEALARGEATLRNPPDNRAVRLIKNLLSGLIVVLVVGGVAWLAGGTWTTVVAAVVPSLAAMILIAGWRKLRSAGQATALNENQ